MVYGMGWINWSLPLSSIDEYIRNKTPVQQFQGHPESYVHQWLISFIYNATASQRYRVLTRKGIDSVFVKIYSNLLAYSPNNENFMKKEKIMTGRKIAGQCLSRLMQP